MASPRLASTATLPQLPRPKARRLLTTEISAVVCALGVGRPCRATGSKCHGYFFFWTRTESLRQRKFPFRAGLWEKCQLCFNAQMQGTPGPSLAMRFYGTTSSAGCCCFASSATDSPSPVARGQIWNPPRWNAVISQVPQMPLPSRKPR